MDFLLSVVFFILCGVMFYGIDSVMVLFLVCLEVWECFVKDFDIVKLDEISYEIGLSEVIVVGVELFEGKVCGCVVVDVNC